MNRKEEPKRVTALLDKWKKQLEEKLKNMTDINNLQNLMIEKNKLQNREKMHISLKDG